MHIKLFESGHEEVDVLVQVSVLYLDLFTIIIIIIIARNLLNFEKLSAFYPMPYSVFTLGSKKFNGLAIHFLQL